MLSGSVVPSNHRQCKPGRHPGRKGVSLQGHPRPWPVAKLRTLGAPAPKVPLRRTARGEGTVSSSHPGNLPARVCSTAAGRPAVKGRVSVKTATPPSPSVLQGKPSACPSLGAIPPHLVALPPPCGPRIRCGPHSAPRPQRVPDTQSVGPSRPRRRRPSAYPHCRSLPGSGSLRSPSPCTVKARHPPAPDRLRGHAPLRSAPLVI